VQLTKKLENMSILQSPQKNLWWRNKSD